MFKENRGIICNSIRNLFIFLVYWFVFFLYHTTVAYDRLYLLIAVNLFILAIFILSVYRVKLAFYIFIFLIPLLNTVTIIIGIRSINTILFLFFGLFMGFLVNRFKSVYEKIYGLYFTEAFKAKNSTRDNYVISEILYEIDIAKPVFIFILILIVSAIITIYRYA
ncbi:MAG: hypothetical protein JW997_04830, partial [Actinobacteria bacterium]|nr:hypothetical protein [Actinomycetota bacterium]